MAEWVSWAGNSWLADRVIEEWAEQEGQRVSQGIGGARSDSLISSYALFSSYHGGFVRQQRIHNWIGELDVYAENTGLQTHIPGIVAQAYALTTQAAVHATDISGSRAANQRIWAVQTTKGQSNLRYYLLVQGRLLRTTSDSDSALEDSTASFGQVPTAMSGAARFNSVDYGLVIYTGGTTNDVQATTNPTATPPTFVTPWAINTTDWWGGGFYHRGLALNIFYGRDVSVADPDEGIYQLADNVALNTDPTKMTAAAGSANFIPTGGYFAGRDQLDDLVFYVVAPVQSNEEDTVVQPRGLYKCTLTVTPDVAVERLSLQMAHVEAAIPHLGGVLVAGGSSPGPAKLLKHIDATGQIDNWNFPGLHGSTPVGIVNMFSHGDTAILEVAADDGSNAQWWYYINGAYHGSTVLDTAPAALPLAWAGQPAWDTHQNRVFRIYPVSTNIAAGRAFLPPDLFADPFFANTSELKQDGPLFLRTPKLELMGPFESDNVITRIRHGGDQISAVAGSYGTVQYELELATDSADIDATFATPAVSTGALDSRFEEYNVAAAGQPYRLAMVKLTLDNDGTSNDSTKTPNGVPFVIAGSTARAHVSRYTFEIWSPEALAAIDRTYGHWSNFLAVLKAAAATQSVQRLLFSRLDVPASLGLPTGGAWMMPGQEEPLSRGVSAQHPLRLTLIEKPGVTAS